ncbi:MAG TPA: primosomal protein N', partial [Rhodospirillales bacterium]|nr:primosomal protein N' [Rhodospirillales bacterium]
MDESPAKSCPVIGTYGSGERVSVLLPLPLPGPYDYRVGEGMVLADGDVVRVPLGQRSITGVVWGAGQGVADQRVAAAKLKTVHEKHQTPPLPGVSRQFVDWVADYTLSPPGAVLKMVISVPAALEPPKTVTAYALDPSAAEI